MRRLFDNNDKSYMVAGIKKNNQNREIVGYKTEPLFSDPVAGNLFLGGGQPE